KADGQQGIYHPLPLFLAAAPQACGAQPDAALDAELLEQVRRVGTRYEETLEMLSWQVRDLPVFESNEELRLEWGFRSSGNMVWVVVVWDTPDVDLVRALAGRLERSLSDHYDTGVISCEPLWQKRAYEEIWHKVSVVEAAGKTTMDEILIDSTVDALDEPLGAVWVLDPGGH
ncbi:unnamed protein product, partial [Prorocentrum cordatum]